MLWLLKESVQAGTYVFVDRMYYVSIGLLHVSNRNKCMMQINLWTNRSGKEEDTAEPYFRSCCRSIVFESSSCVAQIFLWFETDFKTTFVNSLTELALADNKLWQKALANQTPNGLPSYLKAAFPKSSPTPAPVDED